MYVDLLPRRLIRHRHRRRPPTSPTHSTLTSTPNLVDTFDIGGRNSRRRRSSAHSEVGFIQIFMHRVIYHLLEEIGNFIVEKAPGTNDTQIAGEGEVLSIFELKGRSKSKGPDVKIAGCRILDGHFSKSSKWRVLRSAEVVYEGSCLSLKREKNDVDFLEGKGNECGLVLDCDDYKVGDIIQCLEEVKRKPRFVSSANGAVRIEC